MNKVIFENNHPSPIPIGVGSLFSSPTGEIYMLVQPHIAWYAVNLSTGNYWAESVDKEGAIYNLTPLGPCEIIVKQL